MKNNKIIISVIGIGYIGLPISISFSKYYKTIAFDKNLKRIRELKSGYDSNLDYKKSEITANNKNIFFTNNHNNLNESDIYIICVPTPIYESKKPNLNILKDATKLVASKIKKNNIVIYESTVYPGVTEDVCLPILENLSTLKLNKDFFLGYCPERINPGDKKNKIKNISKVISASNSKSLRIIHNLYSKIIKAKIFKAKSIKVAEAAKIIENTQRDVNIALMNELSIIFDKINIDIFDVLEASETKWNFNKYYPGLVGGHCIGVDPYYLQYLSKQINVPTSLITSGRNINDDYSKFVFKKIKKIIAINKLNISKVNFLLLGLTFKENCPDFRNSKVFDIINIFENHKLKFKISDPYIKLLDKNIKNKLNKHLLTKNFKPNFFVILVPHAQYKKEINKIFNHNDKEQYIFDLKGFLNSKIFKKRNINYYR